MTQSASSVRLLCRWVHKGRSIIFSTSNFSVDNINETAHDDDDDWMAKESVIDGQFLNGKAAFFEV